MPLTVWSIMLAITFLMCTVALIFSLRLNTQIDELRSDSQEMELKVAKISELNAETADTDTITFILKNHNGVIGVFDQFGVLTDIIDVDIKSLPEQDRTMLEAGIWARSRQELASLIEDYTG